jgi:hypothetical protein
VTKYYAFCPDNVIGGCCMNAHVKLHKRQNRIYMLDANLICQLSDFQINENESDAGVLVRFFFGCLTTYDVCKKLFKLKFA